MLIRFVATNFRSYGQETEFNMLPSQNVRRNEWHVHSNTSGVAVLRTSVIYGANGAGKSCLIKAIGRLRDMIISGTLPATASRDSNKFINTDEPVSLEIEFTTSKDQFSYGVSYRGCTCIEEWLYSTSSHKKPKCIFERKKDPETNKTTIKLLADKKDDAKNKLLVSLLEENLLKTNELLISKHDVLKNPQITDAFLWIATKLNIIYPETHSTSIFDKRYSDDTFRQQSESLVDALDLGIKEFMLKDEDLESFKQSISEWPELVQGVEKIVQKLSRMPEHEAMVETGAFTISIRREGDKYFVRRVKSVHNVNNHNYDFELKEESDGTQRIFDFLPMVQEVKNFDSTYVIDELDRSLHPTLVRALTKHIVTDKGMKGQLIFTTHDAGLLDGNIFRNDEIWFAEKDRETQNTHLYTLDEFKPRTDLNLEKGYLNGRFGAIPFLAKLNELNWE